MIGLTRRAVLWAGLLFAATRATLPAAASQALAEDRGTIELIEGVLTDIFPKQLAVRCVGSNYLGAPIAEKAALARTLSLFQRRDISSTDGRAEVRQHIRAKILQDFELNRTVSIDRWILSKTEAELCAICVLAKTS